MEGGSSIAVFSLVIWGWKHCQLSAVQEAKDVW